MDVVSTKRSLRQRSRNGKLLQHLEPVAVVPSTLSVMNFSRGEREASETSETVVALTAIVAGLLEMTLSEDVIYLAMNIAKQRSLAAGVSEEEFTRVSEELKIHWVRKKSLNPLASMF